MSARRFAVTIDLDTAAEDLAPAGGPAAALRRASYLKALPRLLGLLDRNGAKATFFAVASHLEDPACAAALREAAAAGHEIASHGLTHDRGLPLRSAEEISACLSAASAIFARTCGCRPAGFRSPGAVLTPALAEALSSSGYVYDSSYNPSAAYNLSKRAYALLGGGRLPVQRPLACAAGDGVFSLEGLTEFPLTVSGLLTLPLMNYFMMGLGRAGLWAVRRAAGTKPFVNYVLHDHELLLAEDLPSRPAGMTGRYLDAPLAEREAFIDAAIKALKAGGDLLPLREIALPGGEG